MKRYYKQNLSRGPSCVCLLVYTSLKHILFISTVHIFHYDKGLVLQLQDVLNVSALFVLHCSIPASYGLDAATSCTGSESLSFILR